MSKTRSTSPTSETDTIKQANLDPPSTRPPKPKSYKTGGRKRDPGKGQHVGPPPPEIHSPKKATAVGQGDNRSIYFPDGEAVRKVDQIARTHRRSLSSVVDQLVNAYANALSDDPDKVRATEVKVTIYL
ncbi:MAG: hypothetical protein GY835_22650 [bacterium]|nr:hypothetical protein [bacterium]